ncbi:hypothetical protein GCM10023063_49220 [Arthrobacter methylotrophus]
MLAAFSVSAEMLLLSRLLLGVFGAMIMPCTLSLLRGMFHDRAQRRLAIAIWATGFSAGTAIGPIVGGVLLEHFHWGSVFLIAVPFLLPLLIFAPLLVTESRDPNPGPIDVPAILLSMAALAPSSSPSSTRRPTASTSSRSARSWLACSPAGCSCGDS